jgi:hypothetical protein
MDGDQHTYVHEQMLIYAPINYRQEARLCYTKQLLPQKSTGEKFPKEADCAKNTVVAIQLNPE